MELNNTTTAHTPLYTDDAYIGDNDDDNEMLLGLITKETQLQINDVISCGIQPITMLIGMGGNVLSMAVLVKQGAREVTNVILIALTLVDLLYLAVWYGPVAECVVRRYDVVQAINMEAEFKAIPIMVAARLGVVSRLYTCLIAVERYIAVRFPFKAPSILIRRRIVVACVVLWVLPFALGFHSFMLFDVKERFDPQYNATIKYIAFSQFTQDNLDLVVLYNDLILGVIFGYAPVLLVLYCTTSILLALRRSHQNRLAMTAGREDSKKSMEQRQVTKTLVSICITFVICSLPTQAIQIARLLFQEDGFSDVGRYKNISFVTISISLLFNLVNSSVNFIFYIAFSKKFTATAKQLFLCRQDVSKSASFPSAITQDSEVSKTAVP